VSGSKVATFTGVFPFHFFRHFCCRRYRLVTVYNVTDRQTDHIIIPIGLADRKLLRTVATARSARWADCAAYCLFTSFLDRTPKVGYFTYADCVTSGAMYVFDCLRRVFDTVT